ncbi:hypothetical protein LEP1GSC163_1144 [Leptospira santarosai str. CBC379]|uniref:Tetratricopeptide repeat protein n=1 Tax=Leptospira santarosai str. MOR084 TaxID=1049984 RepID=A0A0E2BWB9_9LEPT|nr:hypothetical protein LEP1GSC179_0253 [Leptospira santarosai str. MOR084]EKR93141.1 hypothetical protein LEP1GSC163_1144 [Leptospira santarosai str. CBC379]
MIDLLIRLNSARELEPNQKFILQCGITAKTIKSYLNEDPNTLELMDQTLSIVPENPLLFFLKVSYIEKKQGILSAMETLRSILPILWKNDFVLTKAFFLYVLLHEHNWEKVSSGELYAFYTKVRDSFGEKFFTDGKFTGDLESFQTDLFSNVLKKEYSKIEMDSHGSWMRSRTEEYDALSKLDSLSEEDLVSFLKPENSFLNFSIASRLIKYAHKYSGELLQILEWEKESVFPFLKLYFQNSLLKDKLFENAVFQKHLGFFIKKYGDVSARELSKTVFSKLRELQNSSVIVRTVRELEPDAILNFFFSIYWAFQKEGKLFELGTIMEDVLKKTNSKKPEYVLIATNLGVIHIQNENLNQAKEVFESLFSMDWSRFDYKKDATDDFADKILGGDLNEQYSKIFKQYYALAKFNAACLYSKLNDPEVSVFHLKEANELGPNDYDKNKILSEKDFEPLKGHPLYHEFLNSLN